MFGVTTKRVLSVCAIVLGAACGGAPPAGPGAPAVQVGQGQRLTERQAALAAGALRVVVRFDAGQEPWGAYVAEHAAAYIVAAERYLGVPHQEARTRFYGERPRTQPDVFLVGGQASVHHNGRWVGGYHANNEKGERGVFIEYGLSVIGRPALLDHEIGHFWIDGLLWLSEGMVSFLPLAMANEGVLALTDGERRAVWTFWGAETTRFPQDLPIEMDFRKLGKEHLLYFYRKAFKVQCLLYRELGPEGYQRFARQVAATAGKLPDNNAAIALLGGVKPGTDFRALLSGWVIEGPYTTPREHVCSKLGPRRDATPATPPAEQGGPDAPASR